MYEGAPEIKFNDGRIAVKSGNGGICSFFPDSWSSEKIEAEANNAANNIVGKIKNQQNMYIGRTKDGKISIVIQFRTHVNKEGKVIKKITSFYPLYE